MTIILQCDTNSCDSTINLRTRGIYKPDDIEKKLGWMSKPGQRHFCDTCTSVYKGIVEAEEEGKIEEEIHRKKVLKEDIKHPEVPTLEFAEPIDGNPSGNGPELLESIKKLLKGVGERGMEPKEIERALDCDYQSMYSVLRYLEKHNIVENHAWGKWRMIQ